jgi:lipoyl(octanoyl) transferase
MTPPARGPSQPGPLVKWLGLVEYEPTLTAMREFTDRRDATTRDEIWLLEHPPVFTLGMAGKREHLLDTGDIPVVQTERGGQVTYHGPGQLVAYPLIDLRRANMGVRDYVTALENAVIGYLGEFDIVAHARRDAPGVYCDAGKLASLGIRIRRGASYHGIALNVNLDLEPFSRINPCGFAGLRMARLCDLGGPDSVQAAASGLEPHLLASLGL